MKLIVGLGNPGREYALTRHNVGWWLVDHLAEHWHFDGWRKDNDAQVSNGMVGNVKVRLMKPQTFMNLSGDALRPYTRRPFWAPATDLLVISDEVSQSPSAAIARARRVAPADTTDSRASSTRSRRRSMHACVSESGRRPTDRFRATSQITCSLRAAKWIATKSSHCCRR